VSVPSDCPLKSADRSNVTSESLVLPVCLLICVILAQVLGKFGMIPAPSALLDRLGQSIGRGSLWFISACSFLENIFVVNSYFPGAFVILFAMASCHGDLSRAASTFGVIVGTSALAQNLNYALGRRFGRHQSGVAATRIGKQIRGALSSYWHPQLGSIYSFRLGVQRVTYKRFGIIMVTCWATWTVFWGVSMYNLGAVPMTGNSFVIIFCVYLLGWIYLAYRRKKLREIATSAATP
jgi:membrane protein DedA with SNARE-associated domain